MADPAHLLEELEELISSVVTESARQSDKWMEWDIRPDFVPSVENLASYLALRHHDLRALQCSLMALGLSSLGRLESRVLPTLQAVRTALAAMLGRTFTLSDNESEFFSGIEMLASRSLKLFGPHGQHRRTALMVTCPSEAADDPAFMLQMAQHGVEVAQWPWTSTFLSESFILTSTIGFPFPRFSRELRPGSQLVV
jgi:pyruvate kinase